MKIIMTIGLIASGKTTWATQYVENNPDFIRVNKDAIRLRLFDKIPWSREQEEQTCAERDRLIDDALRRGYSVIVDDTNFEEKHRVRIEEIASLYHADVEMKDFTDVPLDVCLQRDAQREHPVGEQVIRRMYERYLSDNREAN